MVYFPVKQFKGVYGVPTKGLTRAKWVALRDEAGWNGIGGSEIGTLLHGSDRRFSSPIRMFYERVGLWKRDYTDNKYAFMGRLLESEIIRLWKHWHSDWETTMLMVDAGKVSRKSRACNFILKNREYPWLFANIDNEITKSPDAPSGRGILECKTISGHAADRYETGIPPKYIAQMQQYMLVTGRTYSELAVLKDGVDFQVYPLEASTVIQEAIVKAAGDFFDRVLSAKEELRKLPNTATFEEKMQVASAFEPPVADGDDEYQFLSEKAKMREASRIEKPDEEMLSWYLDLQTHAAAAKENDNKVQYYKNQIRQRMVNENIYQFKWPDGSITNGKRFIIK